MRVDHQGLSFAFNNPPAGDKLPKVRNDLGQLLGGAAFCTPPACFFSLHPLPFSREIFLILSIQLIEKE